MSTRLHENREILEEEEDRLSPLQDDLLCRILSRLPTKDIVATSALSTRWRHLYASVTDFYFSDSPTSGNATNTTNFVNFMSNVISAVQTTSKYFRKVGFSCTNGAYTCSLVGSWISAVSGPNLQDLEVFTLGLIDPVPLPPQLFLCRSLTRLRLKGTFSLCVPENVLFPSLKSLDMCDLILPDHLSPMKHGFRCGHRCRCGCGHRRGNFQKFPDAGAARIRQNYIFK